MSPSPPYKPSYFRIGSVPRPPLTADEVTCPVCARARCYGLVGHVAQRLAWAARTARRAQPTSFAARSRLLWHDIVVHGLLHRGTERCQDCGRACGLWHAVDDDWGDVMGGPSGVLCEPCFTLHQQISEHHHHDVSILDVQT